MRRITAITAACAAAMLAVPMPVTGETVRYSLDIDVGGLRVDTVTTPDGHRFIGLGVEGLDNTAEMDEPVLPVKHVTIAVPTYCNNISTRVTGSRAARTLPLGYPVLPFKDCTTNENPDDILYMPLSGKGYSLSVTTPQAQIVDEFFLNGSEHFVTLAVCPVAYDATGGKVRVFGNVEVEVSFSACGKDDMRFRPLVPKDGVAMYDSSQLDCYDREGGRLVSRRAASSAGDEYAAAMNGAQHYIILVPANLRDAVDGLADWKRQKGYKVTVETYETILANPLYKVGSRKECFDRESGIREWMRDFYSSNGAFHCLLVGDYRTSAPIRKFRSKITTGSTIDHSDTDLDPTDAYFADLITDWEFSKISSGIYVTDTHNAAFSPTVSVGRLLCHKPEHIINYIKKIPVYEAYPGRGNPSYLKKGVVVHHKDTKRYNTCFTLFEWMDSTVFIDNNSTDFESLRPYPTSIVAELGKSGFHDFTCHGLPLCFEVAKSKNPSTNNNIRTRYVLPLDDYKKNGVGYNESHNAGFDSMKNKGFPGILYATSCTVTPFDDITYRSEDNGFLIKSYTAEFNLGSGYTVAGEYGGVAFLGNTREGHGRSGCQLEMSFANIILKYRQIGLSEYLAKTDFKNRIYPLGKETLFRHNIIGDPEICMWIFVPSNLSGKESTTSGVWTLNATGLKNGSYGISFGNTSLRNSYANANGKVSISFRQAIANNPKAAIGSIFVSEKDCLPYMQLFTTGAQITGQQESYTLVKGAFGSSTDNSYRPVLNLGKNADISVSAYTDITSDNGITVDDGGKLTMNADGKASFSNDEVKTGGSLTVSASKVTIEGGFSVTKGGKLNITPRKEKL